MTRRRGRGEGGIHWDEKRQRFIASVTIGYSAAGKRIDREQRGTVEAAVKRALGRANRGSVAHTLDMFVDSDLKIVAQIVLPVQHCLLSNCKRSQIKRLYSHPQSLGQCRGWVQSNLPRAEIIELALSELAEFFPVVEEAKLEKDGLDCLPDTHDLPFIDVEVRVDGFRCQE